MRSQSIFFIPKKIFQLQLEIDVCDVYSNFKDILRENPINKVFLNFCLRTWDR